MKWGKAQDLGLFAGDTTVLYPEWFHEPERVQVPYRWPPRVSQRAYDREIAHIMRTGTGTDVDLLRVQGQPSQNLTLEVRDRVRQSLFEEQRGLCHWCQKAMDLTQKMTVTMNGKQKTNPRFATFEHLIPRALGGRFNKSNIRLAHASCNHKREARPNLPRYAHDPMRRRHGNP